MRGKVCFFASVLSLSPETATLSLSLAPRLSVALLDCRWLSQLSLALSVGGSPQIAQERFREKREEMNRLQRFVDENDNLISLVKKLPEKLHHNIMASFSIHSTDRTSKQTVDVLRRRDKTLQSQIHSLKAEIDDFQTEASFFANTALEAAVCFFCWCFILFSYAYAS